MKRTPRRSTRTVGLIPKAVQGIGRLLGWGLRHPKPWLAVALLGGLGWLVWRGAQEAHVFRISHVRVSPDTELRLPDSILGSDLWQLDLDGLSEQLARQQPHLKMVRVVRELPNAIRVEPVARVPVAQVRLDRWYPVDQEGYLLPEADVTPETPVLIHVTGLESAHPPLKVGRLNDEARLQTALRVLSLLGRAPGAIARHVTGVDVEDAQQLRLVLDGDTEVRCGSEAELQVQLERLASALKMIAKARLTAEYIDVRFQDPVIMPRESDV